MKKLITILFAGMLVLGLSAQTDQGTIILEGGSSLNWTNMSLTGMTVDGTEVDPLSDMSSSVMDLSATVGYFVMNGLAVGLLLDYSSTTTKMEGLDDDKNSSMTFGPMARYYIGETGVWGQLSYGMGSEDDGDSGTDDQETSIIAIGAGYSIYLAENVSFSPSLGYVMATSEIGDIEMSMSGLVFSAGIAIHLGN